MFMRKLHPSTKIQTVEIHIELQHITLHIFLIVLVNY